MGSICAWQSQLVPNQGRMQLHVNLRTLSKTTFSQHEAVMANAHLILHLNFPSLLISISSQLF